MPRGGEFSSDPTIQSDNAISSTENKITGAPKDSSSDVSSPPHNLYHESQHASTLLMEAVCNNRIPFPQASIAPAKQRLFPPA